MGFVNLHFELRKENSMGLRPAAARRRVPPEGKGQKEVVWSGQPDKDREVKPKRHTHHGVRHLLRGHDP
ncbi:hypothetical protein AR679_gp002 [Yellowstone lake phycodnavirus 1]|uniref:hypothetical protein n=1 Tax=Yellowstone lake phycodnavirus 1 TaxID=1586713 RepID=UPI0006EB3D77|nr:hypothetical protein AR679_gp002 [Yellowstone lake phycodnavirus 1]BAT22028.1 hypothetical protein [Yellowstone lake phycodnavirus 1]